MQPYQICHNNMLNNKLTSSPVLQVPSDRYQGVAAANLVYRNGSRNVGLVYEDAAYGYGLAFNFIAGFTNGGIFWHCRLFS
jgi:ABC-type branched-subunit amino acid transport system substrate-binding protein